MDTKTITAMCKTKNAPKHIENPQPFLESLLVPKSRKGGKFTIETNREMLSATYKIRTSLGTDGKTTFTHVYTTIGHNEFQYLGRFDVWGGRPCLTVNEWVNGEKTGKRVVKQTKRSLIAAYLLNAIRLKQWDWVEKNVRVFHFGRCVRCNTLLHDAKSIQLGIGPVCRNK